MLLQQANFFCFPDISGIVMSRYGRAAPKNSIPLKVSLSNLDMSHKNLSSFALLHFKHLSLLFLISNINQSQFVRFSHES